MNYEKVGLNINTIPFSCTAFPNHNVVHVFTDGTTLTYTTSGQNIDVKSACVRAYNYAKDNGKTYALTMYQIGETRMSVVVPSYYDYVGFYYGYDGEVEINDWYSVNYNFNSVATAITYNTQDYLAIGLSQYNQWFNLYNEYTYDYFTKPQAFGEYDTSVYDFTSLYEDTLYVVGNGLTLHTHGLAFDYSDWGETINFNFYLGSPYSYYRDLGYTEGYANGSTDGYNNGLQDGISQGLAMGGQGVETATAFTYISGAFTAVNNVLSIEVLPHITIGTCFSIPLVLVLIMTIFKLVKK